MWGANHPIPVLLIPDSPAISNDFVGSVVTLSRVLYKYGTVKPNVGRIHTLSRNSYSEGECMVDEIARWRTMRHYLLEKGSASKTGGPQVLRGTSAARAETSLMARRL